MAKSKNDDKKTLSVRVNADVIEYISKKYGNVSYVINTCLTALMHTHVDPFELGQDIDTLVFIRKKSLIEIAGVFNEDEWALMRDALNGPHIQTEYRCSNLGLKDRVNTYGYITTNKYVWVINKEEFFSKIDKLTSAQVEAIKWRVEEYWNDKDRETNYPDFCKW